MIIALLACVCTWADLVVPPDGANNVGTNATIVVLGEHQTVALQNASGLDIPVTGMTLASQPGDVWTPFARLGAGQDFRVVVDGQVLSTFTTGPSADLEPPSQSGFTAATAVQADIAGCDDCTPQFLALSAVGTPAPGADYFEIAIGSSVFTVLPAQIGTLYAMSGAECALPLPHLVPGDNECLTITPLDFAGNRGQPETKCFEVLTCAETLDCQATTCTPVAIPDPPPEDKGGCTVAGTGQPAGCLLLLLLTCLARLGSGGVSPSRSSCCRRPRR